MRAYGKIQVVKGGTWKKDLHPHDRNHRKQGMWWEDFSSNPLPRTTLNRLWRKEAEKEVA